MSFYLMAIAQGGPSLAVTVTSSYPVPGTMLAIFVLKERERIQGWIGLLICVGGIAAISYSPGALAVLSYRPAVGMFTLAALSGMTSALAWYFAIDTIGAAKALCLNVTYSMWAVVFSIILVGCVVTHRVFIGSACIILGVNGCESPYQEAGACTRL